MDGPYRRALEEANAELKNAEIKLAGVKAKVIGLQKTLAKLTSDYQQAVDEKVRCQEEADATTKTIHLANRLVGGLASEKVSYFKVEKILKGSLDSIQSPSPSVKIQIMGGRVCLRCKGKTLMGIVNKLLETKTQHCFDSLPQGKFPANNLNFH